MTLIYPIFLLGLLAIAVPVLLHLLKHKVTQVKKFPSFFFLQRRMMQKERRNTLLRYLVLALRCLTVAALALAFAYPVFSEVSGRLDGAKIILVDGSFSTEAANSELTKTLLAELRDCDAKHPVLLGVIGEESRYMEAFSGNAASVEQFWRKHWPTRQKSNFGQAVFAADARLGSVRAPLEQKVITIITDHQWVPWEHFPNEKRFKHTGKVILRQLEPTAPGNIALTEPQFLTPYRPRQAHNHVAVTITNYQALSNSGKVLLQLAKQPQITQSKTFTLSPFEQKQVEFELDLTMVAAEPSGAIFSLELDEKQPNAYHADDQAYLAFNAPKLPRLFYQSKWNIFIEQSCDGAVQSQLLTEANFAQAATAELLLFDHPSPLRLKRTIELAKKQLANGGTTIINYTPDNATIALAGALGIKVRKLQLKGTYHLQNIQFDHPILQAYLKINSGAWFDMTFFDVPQIVVPAYSQILASFGPNLPAIVELPYDKGRIFFLAMTPERTSGNWQTYGTFLPFWRELLLYAAKPKAVSEKLLLNGAQRPLQFIEFIDFKQNEVYDTPRTLAIERPGLYSTADYVYQVNIDPAESNPDSGKAALPDWDALTAKQEDASGIGIASDLFAQDNPVKILLLLALLAMLAELCLSNRTVR